MTALLARRRIELARRLRTLDRQMARLRRRNEQSSESILGDADVAVTFSSHGTRVNDAFYAVESIGRGTVRPRSITLYLDNQQAFDGMSEPLLRLIGRGLDVQLSDNYGPHTKYYPYVVSQPRHARPLVTADDDTIYRKTWLRDLLRGAVTVPGVKEIVAARVKTIMLDANGFEPYLQWPFTISKEPNFLHFATGVAGVYYPPAFLDLLREAGTGFVGKCERADDVWLHAIALRNGYRVRQLRTMSDHPPAIPSGKALGLRWDNVTLGGNDRAIANTYTDDDLAILRAQSARLRQSSGPVSRVVGRRPSEVTR